MDTPTASRSSRPPLHIALIAVVALVALVGCSSSESTSSGSGSGSGAGGDAATDDMATNDVATDDVATSTEVNLTLEFDPVALEELLASGSTIVVAREVEAQGAQTSQLVWLSMNPMEMNEISYDTDELSVFASQTQLENGAVIEQIDNADISTGGVATWDGDQFEVSSDAGPADAVTVMSSTDYFTVTTFGLAGLVTMNGSRISAPYVAASVPTDEMVQFVDTGRVVVWVSSDPFQPGTVTGQLPPNATAVDTASQPNATLRFDQETGTFELAN